MKVLRVIGNVLIGIILFCLILSLSLIKSTKNFLEKDLILGVVKTSLVETINKGADKIKSNEKEIIDELFSDHETGEFVGMVIDNFNKYQLDKKSFSISEADAEKISSYLMKHKSEVIKISGDKVKDISDEEFKKLFSTENINKFANEIFEEVSDDIGSEIDKGIKVYNKITSDSVTIILIVSIIFCIILLALINWSVYKWMLVPGIDLIVSGLIMTLIFIGGVLINDILSTKKAVHEAIGNISFSAYIIVGAIEVVLGIILVVVYNVLKNRNLNQKIKELGTGE